jgi:hypothetical protein
MPQSENEEKLLSAEAGEPILRVWCEANPAMAESSVRQAMDRLRALEDLWTAWKTVRDSRMGYDLSMPYAVKAMERADKALLRRCHEAEPVHLPSCCGHDTQAQTLPSAAGTSASQTPEGKIKE